MHFELKKNFDNEILELWKDLEKKNKFLIFQSLKWNLNWCKFSNNVDNVRLFVLYKNNYAVGIFPMFIEKKNFIKTLRWIGYDTSDYLSPIIDKSIKLDKRDFLVLWNKIIASIKKDCDLIVLNKQIKNNEYFYNPITEFLKCKKTNNTFGFKLQDSQNFFKEKNRALQKYRWSKRKIGEIGKLSFEPEIDNIDQKKDLISKLISWKLDLIKNSKKISSAFNKNFYIDLLENQSIHISGLKLNNDFIAISLGLSFGRNYIYLVPAYKKNKLYNKFSPGKILMIELIQHFIEKKFEYFDFANGEEEYKLDWSNTSFENFTYVYSNNILGFVFKTLYFLKISL